MATSILILKRPSATSTRVVCVIRDGKNVYIKLYTRVSINPKHWSKRTQTVLSANPNAILLNRYLRAYKKKALDVYLNALSQGIKPDSNYLKAKLLPRKIPKAKNNFWDSWRKYLTAKKNHFAKRSFVKYNALENHLRSFEKHQNQPFHLDEIDSRCLNSLQSWFYEYANINTQTTAKYIDNFKSFLNWCVKFKLRSDLNFWY